jgi:hypothetical protein
MAERVEHWFNRRYGVGRRDFYLLRSETGWQVRGRQGGSDGDEVAHYFDDEQDARAVLQRRCCVARSTDALISHGAGVRSLGRVR